MILVLYPTKEAWMEMMPVVNPFMKYSPSSLVLTPIRVPLTTTEAPASTSLSALCTLPCTNTGGSSRFSCSV